TGQPAGASTHPAPVAQIDGTQRRLAGVKALIACVMVSAALFALGAPVLAQAAPLQTIQPSASACPQGAPTTWQIALELYRHADFTRGGVVYHSDEDIDIDRLPAFFDAVQQAADEISAATGCALAVRFDLYDMGDATYVGSDADMPDPAT